MRSLLAIVATLICLPISASLAPSPPGVTIAKDGDGFALTPSGRPFTPWGFNYDRDYRFRLIEDYWDAEWATVEQDFKEMRELGANVVRIHLQFAKFMEARDKPNEANLARLEKLVRLAEDLGLYIDITGLGSYRAKDIPAWYNAMSEQDRRKLASRW